MNWRWLLYDYIPPELKISRDFRKGIRKKVRSDWHLLLGKDGLLCLFIWLISLTGCFYLLDWLMNIVNASGLMMAAFTKVITIWTFAGVVYFSHCLIFSPLSARRTYEILRQSGYDVCAQCGYWLKGLDETTDHCPECGTKRETLPEPTPKEHADLQ